MKKLVLIVFLALTGGFANADKLQGYYISITGEKVNVIFKVPVSILGKVDFIKMQKKVKYIDDNGKKHKLKPTDAKEFGFTYKETETRYLSRKNNLKLSER